MKFKTNLKFPVDSEERALIHQFPKTVNSIIEQVVKERYDFYKRYRSNQKLFIEEHEDVAKVFFKEVIKNKPAIPSSYGGWLDATSGFVNDWNDWLFDYCFSDVTEKS